MTPEHESEPQPLTLEEVARIGVETMRMKGERVPIWVVEEPNRFHTMAHDDLLLPEDLRLSEIYQIGVGLSRNDQIEQLEHVYLMTEGWMSKVGAGKGLAVYYAEGEDRTKTVRVSQVHVPTNVRESVVFEVIRDARGEWESLKPRMDSEADAKEDTPFELELVTRLVKGYTDGKRGDNP